MPLRCLWWNLLRGRTWRGWRGWPQRKAGAPRFLSDDRLGLGNALLLAVVSSGIATIIHLAIITTGARAQDWLADPRRQRLAQRAFALVMVVAVAVSFVVTDLALP